MTKDELRRRMPVTAAVVDEFRHLMQDGGRVIYASEAGHVIDRREPVRADQVFEIPPRYGQAAPLKGAR